MQPVTCGVVPQRIIPGYADNFAIKLSQLTVLLFTRFVKTQSVSFFGHLSRSRFLRHARLPPT